MVVFVALGVAFLAVLMKMNPENSAVRDARYKASSAIKLCWQGYEKKSLDPGTKRLVASVCEKMEGEFKQKYSRDP